MRTGENFHNDDYQNPELKREGVDFLDENLQLSIGYSENVGQYFPEVNPQDLEAGRERYRILLGRTNLEDSSAHVEITHVVEITPEENQRLFAYNEGSNHVSVDMAGVQEYVRGIQGSFSEYRHVQLIGDMHTHPTTVYDLNPGQHPCDPSQADLEDVARDYENGLISPNQPFVFAIAGPQNGQTVYAFYRLFKRTGIYHVQRV